MIQKGTSKRRIPMTVTFLELTAKPSSLPPPQPRSKVALLKCDKPPTHFYRYLYDTIGEGYYWVDRKRLTPEALRAAFDAVDLGRPIVTTCGSGLTAAVLSLALDEIGARDVALYDGSWTEWGGRPEAPVVTG